MVEPGFLDPRACGRPTDRLDRRDLRLADTVDRGDAGTGGDAVDMHGAGATQCHAATEFCAGHAEHVPQDPEQRCVAVDIDAVLPSIDVDIKGHDAFSFLALNAGTQCTRHLRARTTLPVQPHSRLKATSMLPRVAFE